MLREKDFLCEKCGNQWFEIVRVGDPITAECCDQPARVLIGAPAIKFRKPYFNRALGVYIKDAQHEEQVLRDKDSYRPSKADMFKAIDGGAIEDHKPVFNREKFSAIAEKTLSQLHGSSKVGADGEDI